MKNKHEKNLIVGFLLILILLNLSYLFASAANFSEQENRFLAKFPKVNLSNIISGQFAKEFEEFAVDHVLLRDLWVQLKAKVEKILLKKENNGIYFGKNDFLFEKYYSDTDILYENIKSIKYFTNKMSKLKTSMIVVPNSIGIYPELTPRYITDDNQLALINVIEKNLSNNLNFVNVNSTLLSSKEEYIYFKTDHHWTMRGAYYSYLKYLKSLGITDNTNYTVKIVSNEFLGSYHSKSQVKKSYDYIESFTTDLKSIRNVVYLDTNEVHDSLYNEQYLTKKDKYSYFMNGNHSLVKINTKSKNAKRILVIKDSYAHNFVPFLTSNYEEIHLVDLRYYKLNIYDYIKNNNIESVLFLYNIRSITNDNSLGWLMQ